MGWQEGWIKPHISFIKTNKKVAVIGSGPSGLSCAQQLARSGHEVVVFEKNSRIGGLLRIGIPDFKMEKTLIDRRILQMENEGVEFRTNVCIGKDLQIETIIEDFDAVTLCMGSEEPRNLDIPGRNFKGIHFAMEFLSQQNDRIAGDLIDPNSEISAKGKDVLVIGGGDTGSDCVGTSNRQGAKSVRQLELLADFAPCLLDVPTQSDPVSPPPMTKTSFPFAEISEFGSIKSPAILSFC
jgi:glutamate synthase (NADPH/NADH) small chain